VEFPLTKKKNEILSFTSKLMKLKNIILRKVSQFQKANSHVFFSYVDYRTKTNAVILLDMGHTSRENMHGRNRLRKDT
jgi:hypothetical protein